MATDRKGRRQIGDHRVVTDSERDDNLLWHITTHCCGQYTSCATTWSHSIHVSTKEKWTNPNIDTGIKHTVQRFGDDSWVRKRDEVNMFLYPSARWYCLLTAVDQSIFIPTWRHMFVILNRYWLHWFWGAGQAIKKRKISLPNYSRARS